MIFKNWLYLNFEICVVIDGFCILGLGDLGVNGVGILVSYVGKSCGWMQWGFGGLVG